MRTTGKAFDIRTESGVTQRIVAKDFELAAKEAVDWFNMSPTSYGQILGLNWVQDGVLMAFEEIVEFFVRVMDQTGNPIPVNIVQKYGIFAGPGWGQYKSDEPLIVMASMSSQAVADGAVLLDTISVITDGVSVSKPFDPIASGNRARQATVVPKGKRVEVVVVIDISALPPAPPAPVPVIGMGWTIAPVNIASVGATFQCQAHVLPTSASDQVIRYSSSDTSVATVDSSGLITAVAPGECAIIASSRDGGYTASADIRVGTVVPVTGIGWSTAPNPAMTVGGQQTVASSVTPPNATDGRVRYSVNDPLLLLVDDAGLVTGIAAGMAVLTASSMDGGYQVSKIITIT
jgi:hypothetical protein